MKLREIMTSPAIRVHPEESAAVAARLLSRYNIGFLPVCGSSGHICGLVTDRDLVTRCIAAGRSPEGTSVKALMTSGVTAAAADMEASEAAKLMAQQQIRRLPIVENGRLVGVVSLGDLIRTSACEEEAGRALAKITDNVSDRGNHPLEDTTKINGEIC